MIASLLYSSAAAADVDSGDVFAIIEASARNNPQREVTGFLVYNGREFLQYIEGPQSALDSLVATLERHDRHHSVRILHRTQGSQRMFPKWAMRRAGEGAETELSTIRRTALPDVMRAEIDRFGAVRRAA